MNRAEQIQSKRKRPRLSESWDAREQPSPRTARSQCKSRTGLWEWHDCPIDPFVSFSLHFRSPLRLRNSQPAKESLTWKTPFAVRIAL
jgi:hypothetical protein